MACSFLSYLLAEDDDVDSDAVLLDLVSPDEDAPSPSDAGLLSVLASPLEAFPSDAGFSLRW